MKLKIPVRLKLIKIILKFLVVLVFGTHCKANENLNFDNRRGDEALITRYVSLLNAVSKKDIVPQEKEIKRELFLALTINFHYLKDRNIELSGKFKGIVMAISKNVTEFNFEVELNKYIIMVKSLDKDEAIMRIQLDGFDVDVAKTLLDNSYRNDFEDLIKWVNAR